MTTTATLRSQTTKELQEQAKSLDISGASRMRKEDLVKAIAKAERASARKPKSKGSSTTKGSSTSKSRSTKASARTPAKGSAKKGASTKSSRSSSARATGSKAKSTASGSKATVKTKSVKKAKATSAKSSRSTTKKPATKKSTAKVTTASSARAASGTSKPASSRSKKSTESATKATAKPKTSTKKAASAAVNGKATARNTSSSGKAVRRDGANNGQAHTHAKTSRRAPAKKATPTSAQARKRIQEAQENRDRLRDLTTAAKEGHKLPTKDRIVLIVRDAYWLQAHWELTRATVERAQVALAEQWHSARPILRVLEIEDDATTNTSERVVRDIEIHGEVSDWYIDVPIPARAYRVAVGYKTANERFHSLARSNKVVTPEPGSSDAIDENWTDIAENCEKIFALSGGFDGDTPDGELRELFEERLRRPMGSPVVTRFGVGAEGLVNRKRDFKFEVDAEMIIYGATQPNAYVTLAGEPVRLRPDGTFTVRMSLPDRRQVLPVVASSADGVEQHTTVLAVERNTKVMEPYIKESSDQ